MRDALGCSVDNLRLPSEVRSILFVYHATHAAEIYRYEVGRLQHTVVAQSISIAYGTLKKI